MARENDEKPMVVAIASTAWRQVRDRVVADQDLDGIALDGAARTLRVSGGEMLARLRERIDPAAITGVAPVADEDADDRVGRYIREANDAQERARHPRGAGPVRS